MNLLNNNPRHNLNGLNAHLFHFEEQKNSRES